MQKSQSRGPERQIDPMERAREQMKNGANEAGNMSPNNLHKTNGRLEGSAINQKANNPMNSPDFQQYMAQNGIDLRGKGQEYQQAMLKDYQNAMKGGQRINVMPGGRFQQVRNGSNTMTNSHGTIGEM